MGATLSGNPRLAGEPTERHLPLAAPLASVAQKCGGLPAGRAAAARPSDVSDCGEASPADPTLDLRRRPLAGVHILAVDDDADARTLLARLLSIRGATVRLAGSAEEALELLNRQRPHVLVSDIGMPGTDGYELIRQVRQLSPEAGGRTPAVALTAFVRSEDRRRALLAGYQRHLPKPVRVSELIAAIARLAAGSDRSPPG